MVALSVSSLVLPVSMLSASTVAVFVRLPQLFVFVTASTVTTKVAPLVKSPISQSRASPVAPSVSMEHAVRSGSLDVTVQSRSPLTSGRKSVRVTFSAVAGPLLVTVMV